MKRLLTALTALTLSLIADAGSPYVCDKAGSKLHYQRTEVESGKVVWNHVLEVKSIESSAEGKVAKCTSTFTRKNGKKVFAPVDYEARIDASGNVTTDISGTMKAVLAGFFPNADIEAEACWSTLPATLTPGDVLPDAHSRMSAIGQKMTIDITERKVLRFETLTTPAGTFDCVVVTEKKKERYGIIKRDTVSETWYSRSVGMVRHDTWKNGKRETTEVLLSR